MDVMKAKERYQKLDKQAAELVVRERQVQGRLDGEHQLIRLAASLRAGVLARLSDASESEAVKLNKELDALDGRIKSAERLSEAHQASLRQIAAEVQSVAKERDALGQQIAQEENAVAFEQWKRDIDHARRDAEAAFADARIKLAALDTLCARGGERFRGPAYNIAAAMFEDLLIKEANTDNGWKVPSPTYLPSAIVHVRPLVRRSTASA